MFDLNKITRANIKKLQPYSSARDEFKGEAKVWLDANENPFDLDWNRYPDPHHTQIKKQLEVLKDVESNQIFIGNGSDEAIDLLFRAFCEPKKDKAYIFTPTYGMYTVSAAINNVEVTQMSLTENFQLPELDESFVDSTGLLFICSPNNPTGNTILTKDILSYTKKFKGIVVVDEAYIDFAETESMITCINEIPNLVVLQTFSKAWGMAGLRVGMAFSNQKIIAILNKIKAPYNVNAYSQQQILKALTNVEKVKKQVTLIKTERQKLAQELNQSKTVKKVFPSEANFLLVQIENADWVFQQLINKGIIVRNRTKQIENALRFTIGTPNENEQLIKALKEITA